MKTFTFGFLVLLFLTSFDHPALGQQPPGSPPQIEGFVPVDTLPPTEQLPAARLLIVAYAFVWVVAFGYMWSLWRRLGKVEGELQQLAKRTGANIR
jgi:CcmD family protein